jgi:ABC-type nitrate/sulfonate/bicarbonate transport system permease component
MTTATTVPEPRSRAPWGQRTGRAAWSLILPVALVVGYQVWSSGAHNPYFPTIPTMLGAFRETWLGEGFTRDVVPSLANLVRGYLLGLVLGVLAGVALGRLGALRRAASPVVSFFLTLPAVALLPLFVLVLGIGTSLQVGVIAFAVFFYVLVTTADAVRTIEPVLLDVAASFHVRGWRRLLLVLLPSAVPQILSAARVTLSIAILVMVVSEMVGASRGIGAATLLAQQSFDYDQMWAGMLLLAVLGVGLNAAFSAGERRLLAHAGYTSTTTGGAP